MDFQAIGLGEGDLLRMRMNRINTYPGAYGNQVTLESVHGFEEKAKKAKKYYDFAAFHSTEKPMYTHHQLRYMLSSPVDSAVYFYVDDQIKCWNPITNEYSIVLDLAESIKYPLQITSVGASRKFILAGGLHGELILKRLWTEDVHLIKLSREMNSITNHIECSQNRRGIEQCILSNNDETIRIFEYDTQKVTLEFKLPWAPNV
jgi:hypothetical protein